MASPAAAAGRRRELAVLAALVIVSAVYAAVHTAMLHRLVLAERAAWQVRDELGLPVLPLPSSSLAWLPIGSTLRFTALAALAVALVAAGRRWAVLLPSAVLLVGRGSDGWLPQPLDAAWYPALWNWSAASPSAAGIWAGTWLDLGLLLAPAGAYLLLLRPGRPTSTARTAVLRCAPLLVGLLAVQQWTAVTSGAPVEHFLPTALLILGAALLATGALPRRTVLVVAGVLPALAAENLYWRDTTVGPTASGHLALLPEAALTAAVVALGTVGVVLLAPAAARWWRLSLRGAVPAQSTI